MDIYFLNSLSGKKEKFEPLDPSRVTVYVCGPTVYDYVHIGNGRPAVVFDVLFRLLQASYPEVAYVRNVTDIDDKINRAALELGEPISALADRFTEAYERDIEALGVLEPAVAPRATHHIPEIIDMIERLMALDHAYEADGHVLFHVPSDPEYGSLSRRSLEDMVDGARVEIAPYKQDPKDFVLWKPSSDTQPGWDSPWGRGRPGWHIECSAMIEKHLGKVIDIHGGGSDLTFPHHENEAAQSRCAHQSRDYVRFWLHNGMLTMGQEKMSKSLGNVVTIRDLRERHSGEVLRYALLSAQYRSQLAWSDALLGQHKASLDRLYGALDTAANETAGSYAGLTIEDYPRSVAEALCDDLNTPEALAAMHRIVGNIHRATDESTRETLRAELLAGGWLLGLLTRRANDYFQSNSQLDARSIETRIADRNKARTNRDYAGADAIRDELFALGIELEDTREGTRWKVVQSKKD